MTKTMKELDRRSRGTGTGASRTVSPGKSSLTQSLSDELDPRSRGTSSGAGGPASASPGKLSLTQSVPAHRATAVAHQGFAGGAQVLPHLDKIQESFGRHDVRGAQAYVGGQAKDAAAAMGALAYTKGNQVAFGQQPDLRVAAHEAAHVVQQRQGVQMKSEIDTPGDLYEREADAVADRVARGESAEALLDGVSRGSPAVQRNPDDGTEGAAPWSEEDLARQVVDVTAVDDSDVTGWLSSAVRLGEVTDFKDVESMVTAVNEAADGHPLGTLTIDDHGSPGITEVGNQNITVEALQDPVVRAQLQQLHFGPDGQVDLGGCRVAKGEEGESLLKALAAVCGVPVRGGVPYQRPLIPGYEGSAVTCYPPDANTGEQSCVTDESSTMDSIWGTD